MNCMINRLINLLTLTHRMCIFSTNDNDFIYNYRTYELYKINFSIVDVYLTKIFDDHNHKVYIAKIMMVFRC